MSSGGCGSFLFLPRKKKGKELVFFFCFSLSRFYGAFHSMGGRWWCCGHSPKTCSRKSHDFSRRIPTGTIASTKKFSHLLVVLLSLTCSIIIIFIMSLWGYLTECRITPISLRQVPSNVFISRKNPLDTSTTAKNIFSSITKISMVHHLLLFPTQSGQPT